jgi:hypothetical protein
MKVNLRLVRREENPHIYVLFARDPQKWKVEGVIAALDMMVAMTGDLSWLQVTMSERMPCCG